jgi:hypothetical protein
MHPAITITKAGVVKVNDRVVGFTYRTLSGIVYHHYRFGMRETDPMLNYDEFLGKLHSFLGKTYGVS